MTETMGKWEFAVAALANPPDGSTPDPRPLASLLRAGEAPPPVMLLALAELLDPTASMLDYKLVPRRTSAFAKLIKRTARHLRIAGAMRHELMDEGNVERAAMNIADRLGITDRWVLKVWGALKRTWPRLYAGVVLNKIRASSVQ